jgi:hypothetical protein
MTPNRRKLQKRKGSIKQTTCSSTINCQPSYRCLEEANLRRASCSMKARVDRVVSVPSIVVRGPHPAGLSVDCNLNCLHYSGLAPAYLIINSAYLIINSHSEHPPLCSFQNKRPKHVLSQRSTGHDFLGVSQNGFGFSKTFLKNFLKTGYIFSKNVMTF